MELAITNEWLGTVIMLHSLFDYSLAKKVKITLGISCGISCGISWNITRNVASYLTKDLCEMEWGRLLG